jgi:hypothetical protein
MGVQKKGGVPTHHALLTVWIINFEWMDDSEGTVMTRAQPTHSSVHP